MDIDKLNPIGDHHLIQLEDPNHGRLIHLGSERPLSSAFYAKYYAGGLCPAGTRVLCGHGGVPVSDRRELRMVGKRAFIRIGEDLQDPYIQITPEETVHSSIIWVIEQYFSGWYTVLDVPPNCRELSTGDRVLPIYGMPRMEMEDDSEYVNLEAIGVVSCEQE